MEVTKMVSANAMEHCPESGKPTNEQLQREYDYIFAEKTARKMLEQGIITGAEYRKLMAKCREYFSPYLADLT